jgi:hypothetical protein
MRLSGWHDPRPVVLAYRRAFDDQRNGKFDDSGELIDENNREHVYDR